MALCRGGDLGVFGKGRMQKAFEDRAARLIKLGNPAASTSRSSSARTVLPLLQPPPLLLLRLCDAIFNVHPCYP